MLRTNLDNCSPTHAFRTTPLTHSAAVTKGTGELFSAIGEAGKTILSLPAAVARLNDEVRIRPF